MDYKAAGCPGVGGVCWSQAQWEAGVTLLFGPHCCRGSVMGLWCPRLLLPLLLSHNPGAVMKDVAFSGTRLRVAGFGCGRGVIFAEDND